MKFLTRYSLRITLPLMLLFIAALNEGYTLFVDRSIADAEVEREILSNVTLKMNELQESVTYRTRVGGRDDVQAALARRGSDPNLLLLVLIDDNGLIAASTQLRLLGAHYSQAIPDIELAVMDAVAKTMAGKVFLSKDRNHVIAYYPVSLGAKAGEIRPRRTGTLFMQYDASANRAHWRHGVEMRALISAGFYAGCFLFLGLLLHLTLTRRVSQLVDATSRVAAGDLTAKADLQGEDEFARLGQAFNQMVEKLASDQEELKSSESLFRGLIEHAPIAIRFSKENGRIEYINPKFVETFGYTAAECPDVDSWRRLAYPDHVNRARIMAEWAASIEDARAGRGQRPPIEAAVTCKDGSVRMVEVRQVQVQDQQIAFFYDITEHKQAEERERLTADVLRLLYRSGDLSSLTEELLQVTMRTLGFEAAAIRLRSGEDYPYLVHAGFPEDFVEREHSILERTPDGCIARNINGAAILECLCGLVLSGTADPNLPFFTQSGTFWTNESPTLLDLPPGALPCSNVRAECIHRGYQSIALVPLRREGEIVGLLQLNDRQKGRFNPALLHFLEGFGPSIGIAVTRRQADEEITRLNATLERRVAERTTQLQDANRELESFSYSVSHDLRAPLRHVNGFIELLGRRLSGTLDPQSRQYMANITEASKRMGELIDDLLSFSRMGRAEMLSRPVDLTVLAHEVIAALEPETDGRSIHWHVARLPVVLGDPAMLRVALTNLIANSVKFTRQREPAEIEVGCLPSDLDETVVFVRDNGVGFDMTYVEKLFGVFQRLHRNEEFEGTGIGLANVRRVIDRHGGRVWAEGTLDKGATFYFSLPNPKPAEPAELGGTPT